MASLKEVKTRADSIQSTRKVASTMKMVTFAKLHKAQGAIENILPYQKRPNRILASFLSTDLPVGSPSCVERPAKRIAIVAFSSNSSLYGVFNANVLKMLLQMVGEYRELGQDNILIYPVGKKVKEIVRRLGFFFQESYQRLIDKPPYDKATVLVRLLMKLLLKKNIDRVELIYHHFGSMGTQELLCERHLPIDLPAVQNEDGKTGMVNSYIIKPSTVRLIASPIPQALSQRIFTAALDSNASGHAARTLTIQIVTDNTNELTQELTKQYNKTRQQAITNELLDIVGGSMAQAFHREHKGCGVVISEGTDN